MLFTEHRPAGCLATSAPWSRACASSIGLLSALGTLRSACIGKEVPDVHPACNLRHHVRARSEHQHAGHMDSKFGDISIHQLRHVLAARRPPTACASPVCICTPAATSLERRGVLAGAEILLEVARNSSRTWSPSILGSGVQGPLQERTTSRRTWEELGARLSERMIALVEDAPARSRSGFEQPQVLGQRQLACGLTRAEQRSERATATVFAGLDTGLNHLLRPIYYGSHHHINMNVSRPLGKTAHLHRRWQHLRNGHLRAGPEDP